MAIMYQEDFNNPLFNYSPWELHITSDGETTIRSNAIGHNASTVITLEMLLSDISFKYFISSHSSDYFRFYIDGERLVSISGNTGYWADYSKSFPDRKKRTVKFEYIKNASSVSASDCVFIGQLSFNVQYLFRYMLQDGEDLKKWDSANSIWVSSGESSFSEDIIKQYGVDVFPNSLNGIISTNPTLLYWTNEPLEDIPLGMYSKYKAVPKYQVIKQNNDFNIISSIKSIEGTITTSGSGFVKMAISKDGGVSWQSYKNSVWSNIDINNTEGFKTDGNTLEELKVITPTIWADYLNGGNVIRFAYILGAEVSTDVAKIDMFKVWYN